MATFGSRLKGFREARGWSQERLGFELDVSKATVSKWENDRSEPAMAALTRMREIFAPEGLTLDELIAGEPGPATSLGESPPHAYAPDPRQAQDAQEAALLSLFRGLDGRRQKAVIALLEA